MPALNPNHPVVLEMDKQWYKLCAILLWRTGMTEIKITSADIEDFANSGLANIAIHPKGNILTLRLVGDQEAAELAKKEGGLPV